jgi:hypothetical protein
MNARRMADVRDAGMGIDIQVTWGPGEEERMRPQSSVTGLRSSKWMSNTAATQSACRQSLGPARWGAPDSLLKAPIRLTHATWNTAAREQELMTSRCERVPAARVAHCLAAVALLAAVSRLPQPDGPQSFGAPQRCRARWSPAEHAVSAREECTAAARLTPMQNQTS